MKNVGAPFLRLSFGIEIRAHDQIAVAVSIDVSGGPGPPAELRAILIAGKGPGGRYRQPRRRAQVDVGFASVGPPTVKQIGGHYHVAEAVPVDVSRGDHVVAEPGQRLIVLGGPTGEDQWIDAQGIPEAVVVNPD